MLDMGPWPTGEPKTVSEGVITIFAEVARVSVNQIQSSTNELGRNYASGLRLC